MSRPLRSLVGSAAKKLQFATNLRPRRINRLEGVGGGPETRIQMLRRGVTALYSQERLELPYPVASEVRQYAERLIQEAVKFGDTDSATMELADFWLIDKSLVHKLFKVLVPRYESSSRSYTVLYTLPRPQWPDPGSFYHEGFGVLELRGNPWPPIFGGQRVTHQEKSRWLINILINGARRDFESDKKSAHTS